MNVGELSIIVQVILAVGVVGLGTALIVALIRNKGEVKVKDVSFSLGHKASGNPVIKRIGDYMIDKLEQIRQKLFAGYLRLLKEQGCPEDLLNENVDAEYVQQMLGNIVWSGNGIKSIKSILEKSILEETFHTMELAECVDFLMDSIEQNARNYINRNYRTRVFHPDGSERERIVSNTEWVDALPRCMENVKPIIEEVIEYARDQYKGGKG